MDITAEILWYKVCKDKRKLISTVEDVPSIDLIPLMMALSAIEKSAVSHDLNPFSYLIFERYTFCHLKDKIYDSAVALEYFVRISIKHPKPKIVLELGTKRTLSLIERLEKKIDTSSPDMLLQLSQQLGYKDEKETHIP